MLCDASPQASKAFSTYQTDAKVPIIREGRINTGVYREISSGSILGA